MLDTEQNIHKTIKEFDEYIESLNIDESKYIDEDFSYLDEEEEKPIKKFITDYAELDGNPARSLIDYLDDKPIGNKDTVLNYLQNGDNYGLRCSSIFDYVKREHLMGITVKLYTDGKYYWDSEEIYHFEKYNMRLNDEFMKKFQ